MKNPHPFAATLLAGALASSPAAFAQQAAAPKSEPKAATAATASANLAFAKTLSLNDKQDFEDATRGLVATLAYPVVKGADGKVVWDAKRYDFVKGDAPATVSPSLWRQEKLNNAQGVHSPRPRHLNGSATCAQRRLIARHGSFGSGQHHSPTERLRSLV
jgi:alkyl sulfatase BDS1-like metallo-beta-lactamase superfamily hydrolase